MPALPIRATREVAERHGAAGCGCAADCWSVSSVGCAPLWSGLLSASVTSAASHPIDARFPFLDVCRATGRLRAVAAEFLLSARDSEFASAVRCGLLDVSNEGLDELFLVRDGEAPAGALAVSALPGSVASLWPPVIVADSADSAVPAAQIEDALVRAALCHARDAGVVLVQCILDEADESTAAALARNGIPYVTQLEFRERSLLRLPESPGRLFESDAFCEQRAAAFAAVLERTASGSLDCPSLCDSGHWELVLNRQRQPGHFDPELWRLYRHGQQVVGILLCNPQPCRTDVEIAYLGVVPEFRGRQFGYQILVDGLSRLRERGATTALLSVDTRNHYAVRLYDRLGFACCFRRSVYGRRTPLLDEIDRL